VSISRDGSSIATGVTGTSYTDSSGLIGNTSYTYIVTPYDSSIAGATLSVTQKTLPNVTSLSVSSFTASQIVLAFSGTYTTVNISRDGIDIATNISGTSYTDSSGLIGDTSYTYTVTSYNSSGIIGSALSVTQKTLPLLSSLSVSSYTDVQIALAFPGYYTTVNITRDGSSIATDVSGTTYTDSSGLTANTSYTYVVTPYNSSGIAGSTLTITKVTLSTITSLSVSSFTDAQIVLAYSGSYVNVSISRDGSSIATNITGTSYTDSSGLIGNTSYTYILTPYDASGISGITSTITQKTLTNITSLSVSSFTASQIILAFSGTYTTVNISRDGSPIATDIADITYTDVSGLTANTSYTYLLTPYDSSGNAGTTSTITQITSENIPTLTSLTISSFTTSQIVLAYSGTYANVSITRDGSPIATNVTGTSYTDSSGLTANTSYTYIVTPYNSSGTSGTASTITQNTLSNITSLSISSHTATQIVLAYTGNYTNVSITRDGSPIATNVTGTSYTDSSGLSANTSYTYIVTPYDVSGNSGSTSTITQRTLADLTSLSVSSYTTSQIVLAYTGNYTNVSITRDGSPIATNVTGTSYTDSSGLTANTYYTYIVTPNDVSGNSGSGLTVSVSTIPVLTSLSVSSFTAAQIVLAYDGSYTNVSITRDGSAIATNVSGTSYTDSSGLIGKTSYTYVVTPYNSSSIAGSTLSITQSTLPNITSLDISSNETATQLILEYSGNYTDVSITRNGTAIATNVTGTTYTDASGLTGDTSYVYNVTPNDSLNNTSGTYSTISHITLPLLASLSVLSKTDTQIILEYSGYYTDVSITQNGTSIASHVTGTTYTSTGLIGNTSYTYIVTPYNSLSIAGSTSTITVVTLPNVSHNP
jgi:hypothetical protein